MQAIYEGQEAKASAQQAQQPGVLRGIVSAQELAAADIVLTTYDALRKDVHRQADPRLNERSLRRPKRWQVCFTAFSAPSFCCGTCAYSNVWTLQGACLMTFLLLGCVDLEVKVISERASP